MCWTPDDDKCMNCGVCFVPRNRTICDNCKDFGYREWK